MGTQPTLKEKSERVGITDVMPSSEIVNYLHKAVRKGQTVHYLPPYRAEHKFETDGLAGVFRRHGRKDPSLLSAQLWRSVITNPPKR